MSPAPSWEDYRNAHVACCDKCRLDPKGRLSPSCYNHVQRAWREFKARYDRMVRSYTNRDEKE